MLRERCVRRMGRPVGVRGGTMASASAAGNDDGIRATSSSPRSSTDTDFLTASRWSKAWIRRLSGGPSEVAVNPARSSPVVSLASSLSVLAGQTTSS